MDPSGEERYEVRRIDEESAHQLAALWSTIEIVLEVARAIARPRLKIFAGDTFAQIDDRLPCVDDTVRRRGGATLAGGVAFNGSRSYWFSYRHNGSSIREEAGALSARFHQPFTTAIGSKRCTGATRSDWCSITESMSL